MICHTLLTILQSTPYQTRQASRLCRDQIWLFIVVFLINERLIVCPSMQDQALQCIHRDVSTRVLLVFVRQRGRKITCCCLQFLSFLLLVCFGALGVFGALSLVYLKSPIPLRSPIITSPYPCSRLHAITMRFWCLFYFTFFSLSFVLLLSFLFQVFVLFCWWNLQLGRKTCNTIFIFSHQESYVCELNLTMTVNYGFLTFCF